MIRVLAHGRDGWFIEEDNRGSSLSVLPASSADFKTAWFDVETPTAEELAWLGKTFHLHPLALEDCSHFDQRPKLEPYAGHLFVVVNGLKMERSGELSFYELHSFLTQNTVITVHDGPIAPLQTLREKIARDHALLPEQMDFLFYRILDTVMDANPEVLGRLEMAIDSLDEEVLTRPRQVHLEELHSLQQSLNLARRIFLPQREILHLLSHDSIPEVSEKAAPYFRDVHDHLIRVIELVEELRENLWAIRDVYLAVAAHRTNETMKRLTLFSVIFLPLTFITGFFGMNFELIPWRSAALFWWMFLGIVLLPGAMLYWFYRKKWI